MAIVNEIDNWMTTRSDILWLHAPAGAGKSAVAQTIAERYAESGQLAASFFFARSAPGRNVMKHLFPTITIQVAMASPVKRQRLETILQNDPFILDRRSGSVDLLAQIFRNTSNSSQSQAPQPTPPFLAVIDGLDECKGNSNQALILAHIFDLLSIHRLPLRFLILSRPESHIQEAFDKPSMAELTKKMSFYGGDSACDDVVKYLRAEFSRIHDSATHKAIMQYVPKPWPPDAITQRLADQSGGYFIYASTIIKFVDDEYFSCIERLGQVLSHTKTVHGSSESTPFGELDKLYVQILSSCPKSQLLLLKRVLGFVAFMPARYAVESDIETLLHLPQGQVMLALRGLNSLVELVPSHGFITMSPTFDSDSPPTFRVNSLHASFIDFLLDPDRSKNCHINPGEWFDRVFHDAFFLACNYLRDGRDYFSRLRPCRAFLEDCVRSCPNRLSFCNTVQESIAVRHWHAPARESVGYFKSAVRLLIVMIDNISPAGARSPIAFQLVNHLTMLCDSLLISQLQTSRSSRDREEFSDFILSFITIEVYFRHFRCDPARSGLFYCDHSGGLR